MMPRPAGDRNAYRKPRIRDGKPRPRATPGERVRAPRNRDDAPVRGGQRILAQIAACVLDTWDTISRPFGETLAVRLFIGNLPYSATEADLRAHFAPIAEPSHVVMPVDRETGRPRGFAFVEFADRAVAEEVIRKFDAQPFQGRNLAVSEARAREDRPPRPPGGWPRRLPWSEARRPSRTSPRRIWRRLRRWWVRWRWVRWRRFRAAARWRLRSFTRSVRKFRPSRAAETTPRQEGPATGTQAARPNQGKDRRTHLRRRRSRGKRRLHRNR